MTARGHRKPHPPPPPPDASRDGESEGAPSEVPWANTGDVTTDERPAVSASALTAPAGPPKFRALAPEELQRIAKAFQEGPHAEVFRPLAESYLELVRFLESLVKSAKRRRSGPNDAFTALHQMYGSQGTGKWLAQNLQRVLGHSVGNAAQSLPVDGLLGQLESVQAQLEQRERELTDLRGKVTDRDERIRRLEKERDAAEQALQRLSVRLAARK